MAPTGEAVRDASHQHEAPAVRSPRRTPLTRYWLLAWLSFLPVVLLRATHLGEADTFWQIRTGLLILEHGAIPSTDPFSWTVRGEPWTLNSWGFDVFDAALYRVGGLPAVAVGCATLVAALGWLLLHAARHLGASPVVAGALLVGTSSLLVGWLSARPQIVDYVAVLTLMLLLTKLLDRCVSRWVWLGLGALSVVWVNLHAAALLGVTISAMMTVLVLMSPATRFLATRCGLATAVAAVGTLANPYGIGLLRQTARVKNASTYVVDEWQHLDPSNPQQVLMFVLGALTLWAAIRRRDLAFTAGLAVSLVGSLTAVRMLPILVVLAVPVLAAAASRPRILTYLASRRTVLVPGSVIGLLVLLALAVSGTGHLGRPDPTTYPTARVLNAIPRGCRVFNEYLIGGYVMLLRPDVAVSLDSRNDLYGARRVVEDEQVLHGRVTPVHVLQGARCVLVAPTSGLARRLRGSDNWRVAARDPAAVLLVRR